MTQDAPPPICTRIADARRAAGFKSRDLAQLINTHPSQLSRWEHRHEPSVEVLRLIAKRTGVSLAWLVTGDGKGPKPRPAPDAAA